MSAVSHFINHSMIGAAVGWACYNNPVAGAALAACTILSQKVTQKAYEQLPERLIRRLEDNHYNENTRDYFFFSVGTLVNSLLLSPVVLQKLGCSSMPLANRFLLIGGTRILCSTISVAGDFFHRDLRPYLKTTACVISGAVAAGVAFSILTPSMCALVGVIMSAIGVLIAQCFPKGKEVALPIVGAASALFGPLACRAFLGVPLSAGFTLALGAVASVSAQAFIIPRISETIEAFLESYKADLTAFAVGGAVAAGAAFSTLTVSTCALAGAIIVGVGILCSECFAARFDPRRLYVGLAGAAIVGPVACRALLALPLSSGLLLTAGAVASVCARVFVIPS